MADKNDGSSFPVGVVVSLLVALAGIAVNQWPLIPTRPPSTDVTPPTLSGLQDVPDRLWEDPFAVIEQRDRRRAAGNGAPAPRPTLSFVLPGPIPVAIGQEVAAPDEDALRRQRLQQYLQTLRSPEHSREALQIIVATVFGGSYPEYAEQRRRTRYALVSALFTAGFEPASEEGLGYFGVPSNVAWDSHTQPRIPFEIFKRGDGEAARHVLILWVDENALEQSHPMADIQNVSALVCAHEPVLWLGPVGSRVLGAIAREQRPQNGGPYQEMPECRQPNSAQPALNGVPRLIAQSELQAEGREQPDRPRVATIATMDLPRLPRDIVRIPRPDDELMRALIPELARRGVDVTHHRGAADRIVLVSELDTAYGRAMPEAFERAVCLESPLCRGGWRAPWVHRFSYLRGLDGVVSGTSSPDAKPKAPPAETRDKPPAPPIERASGGHQYDYLLRLTDRIAAEVGRGENPGSVAAVGVFGSDFYDKSLVFQALRKRFPKAIFFTTDLDARLLHSEEYRWTRNLVVASSFGLELHPDLQKHVPPFRDSYQTATFLAARALLDQVSQDKLNGIVRPRVFEIGRGTALDLSGPSAPGARCHDLRTCEDVHPAPAALLPVPGLHLFATAVLIAASGGLLLVLGNRHVMSGVLSAPRRWSALGRARAWVVAGAAIGLGLVTVAVLAVLHEGSDGEPFRLLSGASAWPTELLRLLAVALSIVFLVIVRLTFRWVDRELARAIGVIQPSPSTEQPTSWVKNVWSATVALAARPHKASPSDAAGHGDERRYDAAKLWQNYKAESGFRRQCERVIPAGFLLYFFGALVISLDWPYTPVRGASAWWVDRVLMLGFCVPLVIWLTLAVSDTIRLGARFAAFLGDPAPTLWPDDILRGAGDRLGLWRGRSGEQRAIEERCVSHWLDIHVIAKWTRIVAPLIYYPFVVLCVMLISRSPLFDNWGMPIPLLFVFGVCGLYAAIVALLLHRVAERARHTAIGRFTHLLIRVKAVPEWATLAAQVQAIIDEIRSLREGAFAPLTEQPVVRAVLLPITSAGGLALLLRYLGWGGY